MCGTRSCSVVCFGRTRFAWIRTNKEEIAQQIPRIGRIYADAEDVIVWLGHDQRGEGALKLLQNWSVLEGKEDGDVPNDVREGVHYLLLLPYWSRVWIVQEVVLAKKARVECGRSSLDFEEFCSKARYFRKEKTELQNPPMAWSLLDLRNKRTKRPLWQIIRKSGNYESTKMVDKVYGFLSLVDDHDDRIKNHLGVDYDKEPSEVLWDLVFEACPPCDELNWFLVSLSCRLEEEADFQSLRQYARSPRTSSRHAKFARIALEIFDAMNVLRLHVMGNWDGKMERILKLVSLTPMTEAQSAAMVGIVLTIYREQNHLQWMTYWLPNGDIGDISRWQCAFHRSSGNPNGALLDGNYVKGYPGVSISPGQRTLYEFCAERWVDHNSNIS
ncbi:uncharacterized protein F4822DRAFT_427759 [Hypoxylon trugodes]|uniref:uncharacterized protein n=1 Tax=Hypoxylon trugodes TaxID=326681 RepID=UPI00219CC859|nr:uncharacterized protein F4822DRAFT_427759 [Hypoxylon trugodes]KAI1389407.1 hypothetical protein F4822DRAFT_427759 [Hypoxylon trugodes]